MAKAPPVTHEPEAELSPELLDRHRAILSLIEELEAVDWYDQRIEACSDQELGKILAHNRDEEKEHASMVLEWLRRRDVALDRHLRRFLFREGAIVSETAGEQADEGARSSETPAAGGLRIGSLRKAVAP
jgi:ferritin-like protein